MIMSLIIAIVVPVSIYKHGLQAVDWEVEARATMSVVDWE